MTVFPDSASRDAILNHLDANMVVEAAAGTGKTTSLVGRLMHLFRAGHHRIAAVTFTHKAAAELRERLERRLDEAIAEPELSDADRDVLTRARAALAECHIGTIHSFCARLLRERPVEAGISPDFRELEDSEDQLFRTQAWNEFARRLSLGEHRDLYHTFETFGLDLDTLGEGFRTFADFPDIDEWIGRDAGLHQIDADAFMAGVEAYYQLLRPLHPALADADPGTDTLLSILQLFVRRYPRLSLPLGLAETYHLSGLFKTNPKVTQKQWAVFEMDKEAVLEAKAAYLRFIESSVTPFRNACLAAVYAASLQAYELARDIYDRLRLENGGLNFQDLLMATAAMLRSSPEVRADLAGRYDRLLIDEVQDTDPVQAEIMFLLASDNHRERDWRACRPRPGSLFIVGDPKQSIYRFRRADIVVYQEIKARILESGGEIAGLSTNFRSQPDVLHWVNRTFFREGEAEKPEAIATSGCFSDIETPHSPAYVALEPGRSEAPPESFHGVYYLETIPVSKKENTKQKDVIRNEAERIAGFIRHAIDSGLCIPEGERSRPARPEDFLIVTYDKSSAALYADAVRAMGLECRVSSGGTLRRSSALALLRDYLEALNNPEDGVRLVAVLRGGLFGISDPGLYRWRKKEREFTFLADLSGEDADTEVGAALTGMRAHWELFRDGDPVPTVCRIVEELGLWAYSALGDDPSMGAGVVATALELLRNDRIPTLGILVERLAWHMDNHETDPLPAAPGDDQAVRIMNLHKTKGLEAPVVFLTTTRGLKKHDASFAVRRRNDSVSAGLVLRGGLYGGTVLARPAEWDELASEEELFLAAEKTRLNYVAATRAGAALIVSVHQSEKQWKSDFLPRFVKGETIADPLPEPAVKPEPRFERVLEALDPAALEEPAALRVEGMPRLVEPTYRIERAKPDGVPALAGVGSRIDDLFGGESPLELGEVLHRLLQAERNETELRAMAVALLQEFSLPSGWLDDVVDMTVQVRQSSIWRRAARAERVYREAPFTLAYEEHGQTVFQRGVIDLVFREKAGWVVVDYKSDLVATPSLHTAAQHHRFQLSAYARAWEKITNERVAETGILFLRNTAYVTVNTENQSSLFP